MKYSEIANKYKLKYTSAPKEHKLKLAEDKTLDEFHKNNLHVDKSDASKMERSFKSAISLIKKGGGVLDGAMYFVEQDWYDRDYDAPSTPNFSVKNNGLRVGWDSHDDIPKGWGQIKEFTVTIPKSKRKVDINSIAQGISEIKRIGVSRPSRRSFW